MIDLDLESTGMNIDSENWLKSSKGSGVKICLGSGSKSRSWNSSPYSFSHNGMWISKIGDSSSRMTGMRIKTDLKYYSSWVTKQESILVPALPEFKSIIPSFILHFGTRVWIKLTLKLFWKFRN